MIVRRLMVLGMAGAALVMPVGVFAAEVRDTDTAEEIMRLRQEIEILKRRVSALEAERDDRRTTRRTPWGAWGDPFTRFDRMQREMEEMFGENFGRLNGGLFGGVDAGRDFEIRETPDGYEIRFDMTGLDKDKIDITFDEHSLTLKGERSRRDLRKAPGGVFQSESFGAFVKTIPLPVDADTGRVKTEKQGEVLIIHMPKRKTGGASS